VKHIRQLEDQSVYILREAYKHFDNLGMLWSMGKDSTVLLWLARKAFFGHVPFPLLHVDTSYKIPEMIEYRDRIAKEWRLDLVVGQNKEALAKGMNHTLGRVECCTALKTQGLKMLLEEKGYTGIILGVRADEESTRAKERYFSPRDKNNDWDFRDQPPELWDQFKTSFPPDTHIRIHPLLDWTDVERAIEVWGVPPARPPSNRRLQLSMKLLKNSGIPMSLNAQDGRRMKVGEWNYFAKMDICKP
jgi:sulfate adenylyltransferase subunit 2